MIKAENLTKIFGGKKALDSVNVTIGEGSIYGLVGSNGSGKSTLLRLASGVYMPDGGSITANGEKIFDNPQIKARIAYLGDTPYFMPNASIKETADFYRRLYPRFDNVKPRKRRYVGHTAKSRLNLMQAVFKAVHLIAQYHMPVMHKPYAVAQIFKLAQIVRGDNRSHIPPRNALYQYALERLANDYVKPVERFVEQ